jgi:tetratricopeptide (TPR) repeat protein
MSSVREEIEAVRKKVDVYLGMGRFDSAEKILKAALTDFGQAANLLNLLGLVYHKQSRLPEAVMQFRRAVEANPAFVEAILNLSATLCDLSEYDEAQRIFLRAKAPVAMKQQVPELVLGRIANQHAVCGHLYEESELYLDAIREYKKALSIFSKMSDVKLALGRVFFITGKLEESKQEFEELIRIDSNSAGPRVWLGIIYYRLGSLDLARQQWIIANKNSPYDLSSKAYVKIAAEWPTRESQ